MRNLSVICPFIRSFPLYNFLFLQQSNKERKRDPIIELQLKILTSENIEKQLLKSVKMQMGEGIIRWNGKLLSAST